MLKVRLLRKAGSGSGVLYGYAVEGHADFADYGKDIVCAGISAVSQTALFGLEDILGDAVKKTLRRGYLEVRLDPKDASAEGPKAVLRAFELGVKAIRNSYPLNADVSDEEIS